jgi:hypothetical protein
MADGAKIALIEQQNRKEDTRPFLLKATLTVKVYLMQARAEASASLTIFNDTPAVFPGRAMWAIYSLDSRYHSWVMIKHMGYVFD